MKNDLTAATIIDRLYPLAASDERIDALWLFGSYAGGIVHPMSDVDIGVLPAAPLSFRDELLLGARLSEPLPTDKTDVVLVDDPRIPAALRQRILNGILIFERNPAHVAEVACATARDLSDFDWLDQRLDWLFVQAYRAPTEAQSMAERVLKTRIDVLHAAIEQLETLAQLSEEDFLQDIARQDSALHRLQIAIQAAIDALSHVIIQRRLGLPQSYNDTIRLAAKAGLINTEYTEVYVQMVGFRNRIVHQYVELDMHIVYEVLQHNLSDLRQMRADLVALLPVEPPPVEPPAAP